MTHALGQPTRSSKDSAACETRTGWRGPCVPAAARSPARPAADGSFGKQNRPRRCAMAKRVDDIAESIWPLANASPLVGSSSPPSRSLVCFCRYRMRPHGEKFALADLEAHPCSTSINRRPSRTTCANPALRIGSLAAKCLRPKSAGVPWATLRPTGKLKTADADLDQVPARSTLATPESVNARRKISNPVRSRISTRNSLRNSSARRPMPKPNVRPSAATNRPTRKPT